MSCKSLNTQENGNELLVFKSLNPSSLPPKSTLQISNPTKRQMRGRNECYGWFISKWLKSYEREGVGLYILNPKI